MLLRSSFPASQLSEFTIAAAAAESDGTPLLFNIYSKASEGPMLCVLMNKTRCLSFLFNVKSPWTVTGTKRIFTCAGTQGSWIICWRLCSFLKLPRVTCSIESALIYSAALRVSPSLLFVLMCHHSWGGGTQRNAVASQMKTSSAQVHIKPVQLVEEFRSCCVLNNKFGIDLFASSFTSMSIILNSHRAICLPFFFLNNKTLQTQRPCEQDKKEAHQTD